jgi:hypothetical protein
VTSSYNPKMTLLGPPKTCPNSMIPRQIKAGDNNRAIVPVHKILPAQMEERGGQKDFVTPVMPNGARAMSVKFQNYSLLKR